MTTGFILRPNSRRAIASTHLTLIIAVAALLVAGAAYVYSGGFGTQNSQSQHKQNHSSEKKHAPAEVYQIGNFLLNVKTEGQLRYVKVEIAANIVGYEQPNAEKGGHGGHGGGSGDDEELPTLDKQKEALARDAVVHILSDTDFEVLKTSKGRHRAKEKIRQKLDEVIEGADVRDILFVSFVMQ